MLNPIFDSLETKYYGVNSDLTFVEVNSLDKAFSRRPKPIFAVKKENNGTTKSLFDERFFAHSKYSFYDYELNEYQHEESSWILVGVNEPQNRSRLVYYQIADPTGEVRNISNEMLVNQFEWKNYHQIEGICNIIPIVRILSKHPSWSSYDLQLENERLRMENERLIKKIAELETSLKAKNRTLHKRAGANSKQGKNGK